MTRPTRQEQAQAILQRRAARTASQILGRRASTAADFVEAFTLERVDMIAEIDSVAALLALGYNRSGPRDGLYIIEDADGFRIYLQERGIPLSQRSRMSFDEARDEVIDRLVMLNGIPFQF
ncbi:MAG: hypothetical protein BMS9Abin07_2196 [Acidimicrobiia bacterium]|nr:MAG: hypothetical protein BMS9Abin07_2196 [Acidimicrobiia bacterium]